jgi:hypothetical protein
VCVCVCVDVGGNRHRDGVREGEERLHGKGSDGRVKWEGDRAAKKGPSPGCWLRRGGGQQVPVRQRYHGNIGVPLPRHYPQPNLMYVSHYASICHHTCTTALYLHSD